LRGPAAYSETAIKIEANTPVDLGLEKGVAKQSEIVATFELPKTAATFGIVIGDGASPSGTKVDTMMSKTDMPGNDYSVVHHPANTSPSVCEAACAADAKCDAWTYVIRGSPAGSGDCCLKKGVPCPKTNMGTCTSGAKKAQTLPGCGSSGSTIACTVAYAPPTNASAPFYEVPVVCGTTKDTLRLTSSETTVEIRAFSDWTFVEAYFQQGRTAMTVVGGLGDTTGLSLTSTEALTAASVSAYPMKGIWTTPEAVRKAPRVYPAASDTTITV